MDAANQEQTNPVSPTLHQLQSAIEDISRALNQVGSDPDCLKMVPELSLRISALWHHFPQRGDRGLAPKRPRTAGVGPKLLAWQVRKVHEHIEAMLATSIRNKDLAALVKLSEFHFAVAFRNSVGETPHEFLIRRRMERAQRLMLSSDMPLCDIASECGLADQAHLSRLFRRVVGESPASWRRARATN
jgi:AraC family transcriptional regulator